jgi:hypothetical protein
LAKKPEKGDVVKVKGTIWQIGFDTVILKVKDKNGEEGLVAASYDAIEFDEVPNE